MRIRKYSFLDVYWTPLRRRQALLVYQSDICSGSLQPCSCFSRPYYIYICRLLRRSITLACGWHPLFLTECKDDLPCPDDVACCHGFCTVDVELCGNYYSQLLASIQFHWKCTTLKKILRRLTTMTTVTSNCVIE